VRDCATPRAASGSISGFLLGHASVQTTERYIGCKQGLTRAVNDRLPFARAGPTVWYLFPGMVQSLLQFVHRPGT
jgi:hypothetical protein